MHSQNDETGILEVLEIKNFLQSPTMAGRFLENFLKLFLWILHFHGGISVTFFLKKIKIL